MPSDPATRQVVAIWGLQGSTGIDLYAVGKDNGQGPWLGRATLPGDNGADLAWTFAGLPSAMTSGAISGVTSVWVGRSAALDDVVMVVGPAGVFKAHIDDLANSCPSREQRAPRDFHFRCRPPSRLRSDADRWERVVLAFAVLFVASHRSRTTDRRAAQLKATATARWTRCATKTRSPSTTPPIASSRSALL